MRFRALGLALLTLAALAVAACGAGAPRGASLHVRLGGAKGLYALSSSYQVTFSWTLPAFAATTGYNTFQDGAQVGSPAGSPYVFSALACGTTYTLGVQAHNGSGGTGPTYSTSYTTPACPAGGAAPVNTVAPYFCGAVPSGTIVNGEAFGVTGCTQTTADAIVAQALAIGQGTWTNSPSSYTYQWQDCTTSGGVGSLPTTGSCSNVTNGGGASTGTAATYTVQASDAGHSLAAIVTAFNGGTASTPTTVAGACNTGSIPPFVNAAHGKPPFEPIGCAAISAVVATAVAGLPGVHYCTNSVVTCGYPDPLSGNAGIPPGTALTSNANITCAANQTISGVRVSTSVTISGNNCTIQNSEIDTGVQINNATPNGLTLNHDILQRAYTGDAITGPCSWSGTGTDFNVYNPGGNGTGIIFINNSYARCAAETINQVHEVSNTYMVSDECWGDSGESGCGGGTTTHNEAAYLLGGCNPCGAMTHDVFVMENGQTAAFFLDDHFTGSHGEDPFVSFSMTNNFAVGGSAQGLGAVVYPGTNASSITETGNRASRAYNSANSNTGPCPYMTSYSGNILDDNGASESCQ